MSKRAAKSSPMRFWTKREEEFLMGCMKELFNQDTKWKLDCGQFKGGFYGECEKEKSYDMLKTSGFGWDDVEKIILMDSDDAWDNYVKRAKDVKGMRNKSFPYYEDWLVLFGKDRATGDLAESPADFVAAIETEKANKEKEIESPVLQFSVADMESISANWISKGLAEMDDAFRIMFENTNNRMAEIAHRIGYAHDLSQQRRQVNAELSQLPLDSNQRLRAATMIVQDAQCIDFVFQYQSRGEGMTRKQYYYVVFVGRNPGIYNTWAACSQQVYGFPCAVYKKYGSWDEANNAWLMDLASSTPVMGNEESIPLLQTIEQSRNEQEISTSSGLSHGAIYLLCFLLGAIVALLIAFVWIYFLG
ncbi:hypothetical protein Acr_12g0007380 [Actinidia rufa]|uniref:Ribonuclease H1 N-terminal domain-containing protein n=1 Tax=Actinidia rufa TaxID=165716 RepID=A0A7J0FJU9_9ERIC|nr:hypothetical protein Acr_12g0007380 [Actinidia rufa]